MLWFRFEAEGEDGTPVSGVLTAPDLMAAREGVEARRLLPVKVLEIAGIDAAASGPPGESMAKAVGP
jgi:hypothetical protein